MPIYEYKCQDCGEKFEKLVRLGAMETEVKCPVCHSDQVKRLISIFGHLGGQGGMDLSWGSSASASCAPSG